MKLEILMPNGFAITAEGYFYLLKSGGVAQKIEELLSNVNSVDLGVLQARSKKIRDLIFSTPLPSDLLSEIREAYIKLSAEYGVDDADVAVRSSATAEDLPDASFAGQQDTFLNVKGLSSLIHYIKLCFASLFTSRAISYRQSRGFDHFSIGLSICIQKMVRSDKASSGVMFTIDTESGFDKTVLITSSWGLGENIVGGMVNPDEFYVFKPTLKEGKRPIIKRSLGKKDIKMIYANPGSDKTTVNIKTTPKEKKSFSINDDEVLALAKKAVIIEEHYSKIANKYQPMDIEWAKDGLDGKLYIVQARPETVQSQKDDQIEQRYILEKNDAKVLTKGIAIGAKIGSGKVHKIHSLNAISEFKEGEVLVTDITDPDWEPAMKIASAVITNRGGKTCHAAIVAREIGVPAVVGCHNATEVLKSGMEVTCDCASGNIGKVYEGPNDGVGLARMEFIINTYIKVHPLALEALHNGKEIDEQELVEEVINGYKSPKDFFVKNIAEGVIVRTSDFKSNEYKKMISGANFEPDEENPMIGYRGASRYYSPQYKNAFKWECEALKMVREEMGLTNVKLMLPFVRTPKEGRKVLEIMREQGLVQTT